MMWTHFKSTLGFLVVFSILSCFPVFLYAETEERFALWITANEQYENQDYQRAVKNYEFLVESGIQNGYLYYNLANTYFRLNQLGKSIGYYLLAKEYLPRDQNLEANLQYARQQTIDQTEHEMTWWMPYQNWNSQFLLAEWVWVSLILNTLFWLLVMVRLIVKKIQSHGLLWMMGMLFVFVLINTSIRFLSDSEKAVVIAKQSAIYSAPHEQAKVLFKLNEGTELKVVKNEKNWSEIYFSKDKQGWIPEEAILRIVLH